MHHAAMVFRESADGALIAPATCGLLTVPDLVGHVRAWCATGTTSELVIDLSEVEHLDDAAFGALMWTRRYCAVAGRPLQIVLPRPGVLSTQEELLLRSLIPVRPAQEVPGQGETPAPLATA
jgi:anti-anti-sigma regulatory factor